MDRKKALILQVEQKYMKPLFGFAINKTFDYEEAKELAAEITYQLIEAIYKTPEIQNIEAFVWGVARNTYKKWLNKKKKQEMREVMGEEAFEEDQTLGINPSKSLEEDYEANREVQLLRRELTLLTKEYRKVLVAHYMQNKSCKEIAQQLKMSESMVKFYLSKGREKVKEGLGMQREYGEKSYNPANFTVYLFGEWNGRRDLWETANKKLASNLLLTAYEQPVTLSELSIETGVPVVFLEEEVEILLEEELMREVSKGKYQTNMFIAKKSYLAQLKQLIRQDQIEVGCMIEAGYSKVETLLKSVVGKESLGELYYRMLYLQILIINLVQGVDVDYIPNDEYNLNNGYIVGCEEGFGKCLGMTVQDEPEYVAMIADFLIPRNGEGVLNTKTLNKLNQRQLTKECIDQLIEIDKGNLESVDEMQKLYLLEKGYMAAAGEGFEVNIPLITQADYVQIQEVLKEVIEKVMLHVYKTSKDTMKLFAKKTPKYLRENIYGFTCMLSITYWLRAHLDYVEESRFIDFEPIIKGMVTSYIVLKEGEDKENE